MMLDYDAPLERVLCGGRGDIGRDMTARGSGIPIQ